MFNNPVKPDSRLDEGTVMQVDLQSKVCKVITLSGQRLDSVRWVLPYGGDDRYGDRFAPRVGTRVVLSTGLGYPVIIGALARSQTGSHSFPLSIDSGEASPGTGNYSPGAASLVGDASGPSDMVLGDRVLSSQGGGLLGLLRAGSVVVRASRAAEVFMSRLGSLVRIVSRNFEHFTDLSSDVYKNLQGRVYRYFGVATSFAGSVAEDYKYHQYYGDTAVAEAVKTSYANPPLSLPSAGPVIFKEQITGASGDYNGELMRRTVSLDGSEEVVVTNGTDFTRVKVTNGVVTVSFKDQQTITIDKDKIDVHHSSGADVLLDANGVKSTFSSGTVQMTSSEVSLLWGAHFCKVHDSGVDLG